LLSARRAGKAAPPHCKQIAVRIHHRHVQRKVAAERIEVAS
jgi:hypothetical protein